MRGTSLLWISTVAFPYLKVKSAKCLCLLPMVLILRIWSCLRHWNTQIKYRFILESSWNYTGWVVILSDCACRAENAGLAGSTAIIFVVHLLTRNYWREAAGTRPGTTYPTGACQLMHHRIALIRWILNRVAQLLLQAKIYLACSVNKCWRRVAGTRSLR